MFGRWDVFEGQFFPEFRPDVHVCSPAVIPQNLRLFAAMDYGFDMLAVLVLGSDAAGNLYVLREHCQPNLTLHEAAEEVARLCRGLRVEYVTASPDLWNRRQETGKSGFEVMQAVEGMPPMTCADNRRIPGWRILREYLNTESETPSIRISASCTELIRSLPALLCDTTHPEDASGEPHAITHAPEALRYAVMSRPDVYRAAEVPDRNFRFLSTKKHPLFSF